MERGHSYLEVLIVSAIISMTIFASLEVLSRAIEIKNKSTFNFFLTRKAIEKIEELKNCIKNKEKLKGYKDSVKDPKTGRRLIREWEVKEKGELIEIRVLAYGENKTERRVELKNYFWKRGGF
ncbi:MAG: hypothetical protein ACUVUG_08680 [Candidatus Aminicenantia bacterium]